MKPGFGRILILAAGAAIVASSALAIAIMGGPGDQRLARMDLRRTHDLSRIEDEIALFKRKHKRLPADLTELAAQPGLSLSVADPLTGAPYRYLPTRSQPDRDGSDRNPSAPQRAYRLCARFDTDSGQRDAARRSDSAHSPQWRHPVGEFCFDLEAPEV